MYRGRLWTMRQYAGFGTAEDTNRRYRYLLEQGTTGLSVAFDLPTQMGYDSDHPMAVGEVGRVGVAIDSLEDMEILFDGIPLDEVSTSMTINSTAAILLAFYVALADERGRSPGEAPGHGPERRSQGVHRPGHLHLPGGAEPTAHLRRHGLLRHGGPELEYHFHLGLSHAGGRMPRRPRSWPSPSPTAWNTWRGLYRAGFRLEDLGPVSPSFSQPTTTSWRKWRSSGRPADCGLDSCGSGTMPSTGCLPASVSYPDRWLHPHGSAAPEQRGSESLSRLCPQFWAGPSPSTPTPTTRPWPFLPRSRPSSPSAPNRFWPTSPG